MSNGLFCVSMIGWTVNINWTNTHSWRAHRHWLNRFFSSICKCRVLILLQYRPTTPRPLSDFHSGTFSKWIWSSSLFHGELNGTTTKSAASVRCRRFKATDLTLESRTRQLVSLSINSLWRKVASEKCRERSLNKQNSMRTLLTELIRMSSLPPLSHWSNW